MPENQSLLQQLEQMLHWKKSKKFYADKLNITENEVDELLRELKGSEEIQNDAEISNYIGDITQHKSMMVKFILQTPMVRMEWLNQTHKTSFLTRM